MLAAYICDPRGLKGNLKKTEADRCYHVPRCRVVTAVWCVCVCVQWIFLHHENLA